MSEIMTPGAPTSIPAGYATQTVTGGLPTITLSAPIAAADIIEFTGTLTAQNLLVVIPQPLFPTQVAGNQSYSNPTVPGWMKIVKNSTSGPFSLVLQCKGGPNTLVIPQGDTQWVYSPDGFSLFAGSGPASGIGPASWSVPNWWIDPVNGSDTNSGQTAATPLKTWARLVQIWGTSSPIFTSNTVTITFLNDQPTDFSDAIDFTPTLAGPLGSNVSIVGQLVQLGIDTINVYTPRNRLTGASDTVTTNAGILQNSIGAIVNDTTANGGNCWFVADTVAGITTTITPPLTSTVGPAFTPPFSAPVSWENIANGDTLVIYRQTKLTLRRFSVQLGGCVRINTTGAIRGAGFLQQVWLVEDGTHQPNFQAIDDVYLQHCRNDMNQATTLGVNRAGNLNCYMPGGFSGNGTYFVGGSLGGSGGAFFLVLPGNPPNNPVVLDGDIIVHGNIQPAGPQLIVVGFANVKSPITTQFNVEIVGTFQGLLFNAQGIAATVPTGAVAQGASLWGTGSLDVRNGGALRITTSPFVTATLSLQITGAITIDKISAAGRELSVYTPATGLWSNVGVATTPLATLQGLLDTPIVGTITTSAVQNPQTGSRICRNGAES